MTELPFPSPSVNNRTFFRRFRFKEVNCPDDNSTDCYNLGSPSNCELLSYFLCRYFRSMFVIIFSDERPPWA